MLTHAFKRYIYNTHEAEYLGVSPVLKSGEKGGRQQEAIQVLV